MCKKYNKKNSCTQPFLTPILVFLTHDTRSVGTTFMSTWNVRDIWDKLPKFLSFQNVFKIKFKNQEHMLTPIQYFRVSDRCINSLQTLTVDN
jgi:hypothetical protein